MSMKKWLLGVLAAAAVIGTVTGCGSSPSASSAAPSAKSEITVGVTPGPYEQIMEAVTKEAAKEGLTVHVKTFSDYVTPDQALANGDIDLNAYQHEPFLDNFNEKNGTRLVSIGKTILSPLGVYSRKYKTAGQIPDGATIAIPNDPTNGGRALQLLASKGWIQLKSGLGSKATVADITSNPKQIKIIELEAAQLPRSLDDTDASVINGNYALNAGLNSQKDALFAESKDSPYVNIIASRPEDKDNPAYQKFVKAWQSDSVKKFIDDTFKGAFIAAW
jgi:D-methionine transport system substrate-binding protein